jgi:hypothetical protein
MNEQCSTCAALISISRWRMTREQHQVSQQCDCTSTPLSGSRVLLFDTHVRNRLMLIPRCDVGTKLPAASLTNQMPPIPSTSHQHPIKQPSRLIVRCHQLASGWLPCGSGCSSWEATWDVELLSKFDLTNADYLFR